MMEISLEFLSFHCFVHYTKYNYVVKSLSSMDLSLSDKPPTVFKVDFNTHKTNKLDFHDKPH